MLILSVFLSGELMSVRFICRCSLSLYLIDLMIPCVIHADFLFVFVKFYCPGCGVFVDERCNGILE